MAASAVGHVRAIWAYATDPDRRQHGLLNSEMYITYLAQGPTLRLSKASSSSLRMIPMAQVKVISNGQKRSWQLLYHI